MACEITKGRLRPCKDQMGGVKKVDFAIYKDTAWTVTGKLVDTIPTAIDEVFRYELTNGANNSLVETGTISVDNGTTEVMQVLALNFPKLGAESEIQLEALSYGTVVAFVHDYNGNVKVIGYENGLDATSSVTQTGAAGGDMSGYTINLQSKSAKKAPFLSPTAKTALEALVSDLNVAD
jgi:hypothetical protein